MPTSDWYGANRRKPLRLSREYKKRRFQQESAGLPIAFNGVTCTTVSNLGHLYAGLTRAERPSRVTHGREDFLVQGNRQARDSAGQSEKRLHIGGQDSLRVC